MERMRMRDIEGKAAREAASECGQRASFNLYVLNSYFLISNSPFSRFLLFFAPPCRPPKSSHAKTSMPCLLNAGRSFRTAAQPSMSINATAAYADHPPLQGESE